jgi:hypothetical protein
MDEFTTVFLFTEHGNSLAEGQRNAIFLGLYLAILGLAGIYFTGLRSIRLQSKTRPGLVTMRRSTLTKFLMAIAAGLALFSSNLPSDERTDEYARLLSLYNAHQYGVAEGVVHVLHTQAYTGHQRGDIVEINGVKFDVNYFMISFGYTTSIAHAGALTQGRYVRIFYDKSRVSDDGLHNMILRVDVKK